MKQLIVAIAAYAALWWWGRRHPWPHLYWSDCLEKEQK